ncbi:MAG: hypothetical protein AAF502_07895 [Bacteroidota bacterium]
MSPVDNIQSILILGSFLILFLVWLGNYKKQIRFYQSWYPLLLLIFHIPFLYLLNDELYPLVGQTVEWVGRIFNLSLSYPVLLLHCLLILSLGGVFGLLKLLSTYSIFRKNPKIESAAFSYLGDLPFAARTFYKQSGDKIVLDRSFTFLKYFCLAIGFVSLLCWSYFLIDFNTFSSWSYSYFFPGALLFLELFWFLNGVEESLNKNSDSIIAEFPDVKTDVGYYGLWEYYQEIWPQNLLIAWHYNDLPGRKLFQEFTQRKLAFEKKIEEIGFQLEQGNDLIIRNVRYFEFNPEFFEFILKKVLAGEHILVICPEQNQDDKGTNNLKKGLDYQPSINFWLNEGLKKVSGNTVYWSVKTFNVQDPEDFSSPILISSPDDLLYRTSLKHPWFSEVGTIIYTHAEKLFQGSVNNVSYLASVIKDRDKAVQHILLSHFGGELQESAKRNIDLDDQMHEIEMFTRHPASTYLLYWKAESLEPYQKKLISGYLNKHLGVEAPLSFPVFFKDLSPVFLANQSNRFWHEDFEETNNNLDHFGGVGSMSGPIEKMLSKVFLMNHDLNTYSLEGSNTGVISRNENMVLIAYDEDFNLPTIINYYNAFAEDSFLVNVVSPPYLFRDYFASNIAFFSETPIESFSGLLMDNSRFSAAMELLERMIHGELTESDLRLHLEFTRADETQDVIKGVDNLFKEAFKVDNFSRNGYLSVRKAYKFDAENDVFHAVNYFSVNPSIKSSVEELSFLKEVKITEQRNDYVIRIIPYDLVYQNYLPGQIHPFNGRSYRLERLYNPEGEFTYITENKGSGGNLIYRQDHTIDLIQINEPFPENVLDTRLQRLELCEGAFSIQTNGYYAFKKGLKLQNEGDEYDYVNIDQFKIPPREYPLGRLLIVNFKKGLSEGVTEKMAVTLSILLKESFYSLFPDMAQYIHVTCPYFQSLLPDAFEKLYPKLNLKVTSLPEKLIDFGPENLTLFIFEDVHEDKGLVHQIFKKWHVILKYIEDYCCWLTEQNELLSNVENGIAVKKPNLRSGKIAGWDFLSFGFQPPPDFLDLDSVRLVLSQLYGENDFTQSRINFNLGGSHIRLNRDSSSVCDFCGQIYSDEAQGDRLGDGRYRCKKCGESSTDNEEQLSKVFNDALRYFDGMSIILPKGITYRFSNTSEIQKQMGSQFIPTEGFDVRAIGLAINKSGGYEVWVENGQPYIKTLATFVHELTHIWQFHSLDYKKMQGDYGLYLVEGHSVWSEIDCLNKIKSKAYQSEIKRFINATLNRKDEYGKGFQLLNNLMIASKKKNAFKFLAEEYKK